MFGLAILLLVLALVAYLLGGDKVGDVAILGAKIAALVGIILLLLSFFVGSGYGFGFGPSVPYNTTIVR